VNRDTRHEPPWTPDQYQGAPAYADSFDAFRNQRYNPPGYAEQRYDDQWPHAGTNQPRYDQPGYAGDSYNQPGYGGDAYNQPGYGGDVYNQASYGGDGYEQAGYGGDGYEQASYGGDGYDQAGYGGGRHQLARVRGRGVIVSAITGLLAAAMSIGVATLAAAFFRPQASPIIAVGEAFIDRTPPALKNFAVEKFGENDKTMLLLGMYVTIALLAMAIGVLARKQVVVGVIGVAVFGLFGSFVAYTRPASKPSDVIPSIIGGVAGVLALLWLAHAATPEVEQR
jgi:hypothetical protein